MPVSILPAFVIFAGFFDKQKSTDTVLEFTIGSKQFLKSLLADHTATAFESFCKYAASDIIQAKEIHSESLIIRHHYLVDLYSDWKVELNCFSGVRECLVHCN